MTDAKLQDVQLFVIGRPLPGLIEAAASVANAIHVGIGGMIKGTLMEQQLRDALGLDDGVLVNIPKPTAGDSEASPK